MKKTTPTIKLTGAQAKKLQEIRDSNRAERVIDRSEGRDTRIARDGGTNRRLRR